MRGKLLLFGFDQLPAALAVGAAAEPFGAEVVPVGRRDYNKPLALLAGIGGSAGTSQPYAGGPLGGRMIVFCDLEEVVPAMLEPLSQAGAGADCFKAVLTPHNRRWDAVKLFEELSRERRALQGDG